MDLSLASTLVGTLLSILVAVVLWQLSERRAERHRLYGAKETVLRDLSKALGEGNVPSYSVISATIRSVLRAENVQNLDAITVEEIADDLLRQITSDPFLDSSRRKQLQDQVLDILEAGEQEPFLDDTLALAPASLAALEVQENPDICNRGTDKASVEGSVNRPNPPKQTGQ